MNARFFIILFSIIFISFVPKQFNLNSNDYKRYKNIADSIFVAKQSLDSFSFQNIYSNSDADQARVAVMIGHIFTPDQKNAIVIYSTSDTSITLNLYETKNSKWNLLQQRSIEYGETRPADKFVFLGEMNLDKSHILLILTGVWAIRSGENFKAFLFRKNKLVEVKGFENYPNPQYDQETKRVYSYMGTSCADMVMEFKDGIIENDSLITKQNIGCDCCAENMDSCEISINNQKSFKVLYENAYKYVQPFYQDFLKDKLKQIKEN